MKFKVGDRVKCVDVSHAFELELNRIYRVTYVDPVSQTLEVNNSPFQRVFERFVLYSGVQDPPKSGRLMV